MRATSDRAWTPSPSVQLASNTTVSLDMPLVDGTASAVMVASAPTRCCNQLSSRARVTAASRLDFCALAGSRSIGAGCVMSAPGVSRRTLVGAGSAHLGHVVALADERLV